MPSARGSHACLLSAQPGLPSAGSVNTSAPLSRTTMVCSNCAARRPSAVTAVQPSSQSFSRHVPMVIMGSMVKVIPGCITVDAAGVK